MRNAARITINVPTPPLSPQFQDTRPDDASQWFFCMCVQLVSAYGEFRSPVVAELASRLEVRGRLRLHNNVSRDSVCALLLDSLPPGSSVSLT